MKDCPILPSRPGSAPAFKTIPLPYWYHLHSHKHPVICLAPSKLAQNDCSLLSIIFKVWLIRSLGPPTCSSCYTFNLVFSRKRSGEKYGLHSDIPGAFQSSFPLAVRFRGASPVLGKPSLPWLREGTAFSRCQESARLLS